MRGHRSCAKSAQRPAALRPWSDSLQTCRGRDGPYARLSPAGSVRFSTVRMFRVVVGSDQRDSLMLCRSTETARWPVASTSVTSTSSVAPPMPARRHRDAATMSRRSVGSSWTGPRGMSKTTVSACAARDVPRGALRSSSTGARPNRCDLDRVPRIVDNQRKARVQACSRATWDDRFALNLPDRRVQDILCPRSSGFRYPLCLVSTGPRTAATHHILGTHPLSEWRCPFRCSMRNIDVGGSEQQAGLG